MSAKIHRLPSVLPGPKLHQPQTKQPRSFLHFGLLLVTTGLAGAIYWFFFFSPVFAVDRVDVHGDQNEAVYRITDRLLGENIFRLNATAVEQDLKQAYPPIGSIKIIRGLPRTLQLKIELRQPTIQWQVGGNTFIIDAAGEIFESGEKPEYSALPKIIDSSGVSFKVGQQIVTSSFIHFVEELSEGIPSTFARSIRAIEITETTFHVDVILEGDIRLRFTTQRPSKEQIGAARAIFTAHPEAKLIDVRVMRWGYWK